METAQLGMTKPETDEQFFTPVAPGVVRRRDRGLCVEGTRIQLYAIMDYLNAGWSHEQVLEILPISPEQYQQALHYIAASGAAFEAEYEEIVRKSKEDELYWRERERQRRAELEAKGLWKTPDLPPHLIPAWEKLQAWKREANQTAEASEKRAHDDHSAARQ